MAKRKTKKEISLKELSPEIRVAIISGVVVIISAILASPLLIEWIRKAPATPMPVINSVIVSVYNAHCLPQDFYVDGNLMATISSASQVDIEVNAGEHGIQACEPSTGSCGNAYYAIWTQQALWTIQSDASCNPPVSVVTITIINTNCLDYDLYLDENYISTIYAGETQYFSIESGTHFAKGCISGTDVCSASNQQEWIQDTSWTIERESTCP